MQQTRTQGQITAAEWRWVLVCATALVLLAMLPFALVPLALGGESRAFMGVVHDPGGTAAALATVRLGVQDEWLWRALHTPEPQGGIISDGLYIVLGQVARLTRLDALALFHVARALAALFMFHALYALAAAIWSRVNSRRMFWFIASVGAGLGWLAAPLLGELTPDVELSPMFPFHAALTNVHLPLAIGCICFLTAAMLESARADSFVTPNVTNGGLTLIVFSITLALVYPHAFAPLGIAYGLTLALDARRRGQLRRAAQWFGWFIVPALPLLVYNAIVTFSNPLMIQLWELDARARVPAPGLLLVALGLPLLLALPGIWRALRRFEPDGSAFMLLWLAAMLILGYALPIVRGKFLLGLMIPVAYFAARAAGDFWFPLIGEERWRYRLAAALVPVLAASQAVALLAPLYDALPRLTLPTDYAAAFTYLRNLPADSVVLSSGAVGVWVPAWTGKQTVYAAPGMTLDAASKAAAVDRYYASFDPEACAAQLARMPTVARRYQVRYVIVGPLERPPGDHPCNGDLVPMATFGRVTLYLTVR